MNNAIGLVGVMLFFAGSAFFVFLTLIFALKDKKVIAPIIMLAICFTAGLIMMISGDVIYIHPDYTQVEQVAKTKDTGEKAESESVDTKKQDSGNEKLNDVSVGETEIYNDKGISIVSKGIDVGKRNTVFSFVISNSSSKDYSIAAHSFEVNGLMAGSNLYGFGSVDVPTGKNSKLSIEIENDFLEENGIKNIAEIKIIFWAYYDMMKEWDTGIVSLSTNYSLEDNKYIPSGKEIYSDDNITVWSKEDLSFVVLNKSKYNSGYTIENCSINSWSYDLTDYSYDLYDEPIHSNSYAIFTIPIDEDFLRDNDISKAKNVEFDILLSDDYWNYEGNLWEHKTGKMSVEL